jgi:hypothetical protein
VAHHLVAEDAGRSDAGIEMALEGMQVGAADSRVGNVELHFAGTRRAGGVLGHLEPVPAEIAHDTGVVVWCHRRATVDVSGRDAMPADRLDRGSC